MREHIVDSVRRFASTGVDQILRRIEIQTATSSTHEEKSGFKLIHSFSRARARFRRPVQPTDVEETYP
jgi:hypothetical protein